MRSWLVPTSLCAALAALVLPSQSSAKTINVPGPYGPTIQAAIDAALDGDTVLVAPGTYPENIDFKGRAITVTSSTGPAQTIIDGHKAGTVVRFATKEGRNSLIDGFTITNGQAAFGAGISCTSASPTIRNNWINSNTATARGGAIYADEGSAPLITRNTIADNSASSVGGGINCFSSQLLSIENNDLHGNHAPEGGALILDKSWDNTGTIIANNLIWGNRADGGQARGGGIFLNTGALATLVNNTITLNTALSGGALHMAGLAATLENSILWNNTPEELVVSAGTLSVDYCDVKGAWSGSGNIDADPLFHNGNTGDLHIQTGSPCIDSGNNSAFTLPTVDIDQEPRISHATVDIGADEVYVPPCNGRSIQDSFEGLNGWAANPGIWVPDWQCYYSTSYSRIVEGHMEQYSAEAGNPLCYATTGLYTWAMCRDFDFSVQYLGTDDLGGGSDFVGMYDAYTLPPAQHPNAVRVGFVITAPDHTYSVEWDGRSQVINAALRATDVLRVIGSPGRTLRFFQNDQLVWEVRPWHPTTDRFVAALYSFPGLTAGDWRRTSFDNFSFCLSPFNDVQNAPPIQHKGQDSDSDGLPDAVESNDGLYSSSLHTGTDPFNPDTDGDGLFDGEEVHGTILGLDLPALGVDPLRPDIFLEIDWMNDLIGGDHSHRPQDSAVSALIAAFAQSPRANTHGLPSGINVHVDYGQGWSFQDGHFIQYDESVGFDCFDVGFSEFDWYKTWNFSLQRYGYFHYCIMAHSFNYCFSSSGSTGIAELPGDDLVVSLGDNYWAEFWVASTTMHELGHNLSLHHGGDVDLPNFKPNYSSLMNYRFQLSGIDVTCDGIPDHVLGFSSGEMIPLDETRLNELDGICAGSPSWIDWNGDSKVDTVLSYNINCCIGCAAQCGRNPGCDAQCDDRCDILEDFDDWTGIDMIITSTNVSQHLEVCTPPIIP